MMLKGAVRGGLPCLVPYLSGKTLSFSLLHMTLTEGLCRSLYQVEKVPPHA